MTPAEIIDAAILNMKNERLRMWNEKLRPLCESPIEEMYLAAIFASNIDKAGDPVHIYAGLYREDPDRFEGDHLWPQAKLGRYRADFLFERVSPSGKRRVIVECDGHDFHEKTKLQAASDKARDRYFVGLGIQVLRFTGSEIYRDPFACWAETVSVLWGLRSAA